MKMKKLLLSAFLSIVFMFSSFVPSINCYAVSISDINTYFDVQGKFYQILKRITDISTTQEHQTNILNRMYDILENDGYNGSRSGEGLEQNGDITINANGDVLLSVDLQNALRESTQTEINNSGYKFVYSFNTASFINTFQEQTQFHAFLNCVSTLESSYILFFYPSDKLIFAIPSTSKFVYRQAGSTGTSIIWLYNNWNSLTYSDVVTYQYDSSSSSYIEVSTASNVMSRYFHCSSNSTLPSAPLAPDLINTNITQYQMFMSTDDMRLGSEGLQPYYVGNDFSTSEVNTTTTLTDSMLNSSISYSDISNYVNNYYVNNQSYPTTENVYNYINNYDGSGGSGGSGDNGSGGDGSNIWDFLGSIGDFLGHLIEGLGNVLSGILSLLTDVIDMFIGENGLPNVVGQLISYFMPFLPDWVPTLIGFSVVLALILGVIKLIRG